MFSGTKTRKSPTTAFAFTPPNEIASLNTKVDQLLRLVKTIHERTLL